MRGRSCITQLVLVHHMWCKTLDDGLQVDAVLLDFAKAFDRVYHRILLNKLRVNLEFQGRCWHGVALLTKSYAKGCD